MSITKLEKETVFSFNEAENTARIYTHNVALQNKLRVLQGSFPDKVIFEREESSGGVFYTLPKHWFKLRPPRIMSDEQRAMAAKRAKANFSPKAPNTIERF